MIRKLKNGEIKVLYQMFNECHIPEIDMVMFLMTESPTVFKILGRGLRKAKAKII